MLRTSFVCLKWSYHEIRSGSPWLCMRDPNSDGDGRESEFEKIAINEYKKLEPCANPRISILERSTGFGLQPN